MNKQYNILRHLMISLRISHKRRPCPLFGWHHKRQPSISHIRKSMVTHWGRATHICVSKLTIIGSDNGLSPGRRQAIIWSNAGILLIWPLGTKFSELLIDIHTFPFKKIYLKMSSGKWRPICLGLNVLNNIDIIMDFSSQSLMSQYRTLRISPCVGISARIVTWINTKQILIDT